MPRRPLELDDLFRFQIPSDPQLSPDGARVAFVVTTADAEADENRSSIWVLDVEGDAAPQPLTHGPNDAAPRWSPDGGTLAFVAAGRGSAAELRRLPLAGGESEVVATGTAIGNPTWSPDGTRLAYLALAAQDHADASGPQAPVVIRRLGFKADGAGLLKDRRRHLFVVGRDGGEPVQLTEGDFSVSAGPAWSPDGTRIAWAAATDPDPDLDVVVAAFVSDAAAQGPHRAPTRVTAAPAVIASVAWLPDGGTLLVAGGERQAVGHTRLFTVPAGGGPLRPLAPGFDRNVMVGGPGYPGAPPRPSADGTRVIFCARDRGCTHVYEVDAGGGAPAKVAGDDTRSIAGLAVGLAGAPIVYVASTDGSPGEVFVDGVARTTFALDDVDVVVPVGRTFTAPDGTEIHGWVVRRPDAPTPGPLLLDIHGGPHNAWNGTFDGVHLYHQTLVAQGWTVVFVNPRGSDGYGEAFFRAVSGAWGTSDEGDFLATVDTLVAEGIADPARLVVTGYSYGGYMTCWLTARDNRFAAAVPGGCLCNLTSASGTSDLGYYLAAFEFGGPPPTEPRLVELSPLTYADRVTAPTLVLHGEADDRCDVGQAEEWFAALRARRVETELVRYPGASHLFILSGRPSHRVDYCGRVADWAVAHT